MLGSEVVTGLDSVAPPDGGGAAEMLNYGQVSDAADNRSDGETKRRHVQCGEDTKPDLFHSPDPGHDATGKPAQNREVPIEGMQSREDRRAFTYGVEDGRGCSEVTSSDQRSNKTPCQCRLVLESVEPSLAKLPGRYPGSGEKPESGEQAMEGEGEWPDVPDRDGWVADDGKHFAGRLTMIRDCASGAVKSKKETA